MTMKKVVSFSGGRTSAYLCYLAKELYGDDVDFVYMDTGAEHPKTYEFIKNVNDAFNLNLTCLRLSVSPELGVGNTYDACSISDIKPDLKPFSEMMVKYGVPYIGGMFCTDRMKLTPFKKYCNDKYGKGNYETLLGIRADEPSRYLGKRILGIAKQAGLSDSDIYELYTSTASKSEIDPFDGMFVSNITTHTYSDICSLFEMAIEKSRKEGIVYMAEISDFEKQDILDWWSKMPFDLGIPEHLGNCVFCPKKSNLKLAAAQRDEPEFYLNWLDMLYSDSVRVDDKTGHWSKMYRGNQSLEQLIATFDGSTGEEIKARMRGGKMEASGSCSESCEVFVCSSEDR